MDSVLQFAGIAVVLGAAVALSIANRPGRPASARVMEWVLGAAGAGAMSLLASGIFSDSSTGARIFRIACGAFCLIVLGAALVFATRGNRADPDGTDEDTRP